jgi:hypothetical protein
MKKMLMFLLVMAVGIIFTTKAAAGDWYEIYGVCPQGEEFCCKKMDRTCIDTGAAEKVHSPAEFIKYCTPGWGYKIVNEVRENSRVVEVTIRYGYGDGTFGEETFYGLQRCQKAAKHLKEKYAREKARKKKQLDDLK